MGGREVNRGAIEGFLIENQLRLGGEYVLVYKALHLEEPQLAVAVARAGANVFPKHETLQRLTARTPPPKKRAKVFGIGLSRTGTHSLTTALRYLGYASAHWLDEATGEILGRAHVDGYDALSDTCMSFIFESLVDEFSDARFIYTTRALSTWEHSIEKHFWWTGGFDGLKERVLSGAALRSGHEVLSQPLWTEIHRALYASYENWADAYGAHDARVRERFRGAEASRLLRFDFSEGTNEARWTRLCSFLEEEIPLCPLPHRNAKQSQPAPSESYIEPLQRLIEEGRRIPDRAIFSAS